MNIISEESVWKLQVELPDVGWQPWDGFAYCLRVMALEALEEKQHTRPQTPWRLIRITTTVTVDGQP